MSLMDKLKSALGISEKQSAEPQLSPVERATTPMSSGSFAYGNSVNDTFKNAIAHAQKHDRPVYVDMNGLNGILVDKQSTEQGMMSTFNAAQSAARNEGPEAANKILREAPESQRLNEAREQRRETQTSTMQKHMDTLMEDLPQRLQDGHDSTVAWIGGFSRAADDISIGYNQRAVVQQFKTAGYDRNLVHDTTPGAKGMGNRIIGAMMEQLEDVGTVHPGLSKKCAEYAHMSSRERAANVAGSLGTAMQAAAQQPSAPQHQQQPNRGGGRGI